MNFSPILRTIRKWDGPTAGLLDTAHRLVFSENQGWDSAFLSRLTCVAIIATAAIESGVQGIRTVAYAVGLLARRVTWVVLVASSLVVGASLGLTSGFIWLALGGGVGFNVDGLLISVFNNASFFLRSPRIYVESTVAWVQLNIDQFLLAKQLLGLALDLDEKWERWASTKKVEMHRSKCQRLAMLSLSACLYAVLSPSRVIEGGSELQLGPSPPKGILHKIKRHAARQVEKLLEQIQEAVGAVLSNPVVIVSLIFASYVYAEMHSGLPIKQASFFDFLVHRLRYRLNCALRRVDPDLIETLRTHQNELAKRYASRR